MNIVAEEVELGIEMEEKLLTFTPVVKSLFALIAGSPRVASVDFRHIVECWAGAPPDVLDEDMNNDLNFLSMALENNHEQRQLTLRFGSTDVRDEMLMGIRNMVAVTTMNPGDDESLHLNGTVSVGDSYANADLNDDTMGDLYPNQYDEDDDMAGPGSMYGGSIGMTNPMAAKKLALTSSHKHQVSLDTKMDGTFTDNPLAVRRGSRSGSS